MGNVDIAYIIPGYTSNNDRTYWKISKLFEKVGIRSKVVKIKWQNRVMTDYVSELIERIREDKPRRIYLLGHSFGAMVAFIAASGQVNTHHLILCSLSPYFSEDLHFKRVRKWRKGLGERRWRDFKKIRFNQLVGKCRCKVTLMVGSEEWKEIINRTKEAKRKIRGSRAIIVEGAEHDIGGEIYFNAVKKYIGGLDSRKI
ncbi:MAG: alpha/beta hydrolase [Candidatus Micrarchaeota archaeon]|nr:alpha/beta hydrolase [Candidatus Micrarchaeota archaeon]